MDIVKSQIDGFIGASGGGNHVEILSHLLAVHKNSDAALAGPRILGFRKLEQHVVASGSDGDVYGEVCPVHSVSVEFGIRGPLDKDCLPDGPPGLGDRVRQITGAHNELCARPPGVAFGVGVVRGFGVSQDHSLGFRGPTSLPKPAFARGIGILQGIDVDLGAF